MKLRVQDNSLRLRLRPSDLSTLGKAGRVEARLRFPGGHQFAYALQTSEETDYLAARFDGATVTVLLPRAWVSSWLDTDRVGFQHTQRLDDEAELHLLVEKDFQCLHKPTGNEETFPRPRSEDV